MSGPATLLPDLDRIAAADAGHRAEMLRQIEALLAASRLGPGDSRAAVFDQVLLRLLPSLDDERAAFAERLARLPHSPPEVTDLLARDEDPKVAVPLLATVAWLAESTLMECARLRGQVHLLALARRPLVTEPVTDLLVERGDARVLVAAAENVGARLSRFGLAKMVARSGETGRLMAALARRADLPRYLQARIYAGLSDEEKARLARAGVPGASGQMLAGGPLDYSEARRAVDRMARAGALSEATVRRYAGEPAPAHAIVSMAMLANLQPLAIETAMRDPRPETLLMLARALLFDWATVKALLLLRPEPCDLDAALAAYSRLTAETARMALDLRRNRSR